MDKPYQIERALVNAVKMKKDFSHSADWISGIVGKLAIDQKAKDQLLDDLVDFLNHYRIGGVLANN
jgi:hypothetical protein